MTETAQSAAGIEMLSKLNSFLSTSIIAAINRLIASILCGDGVDLICVGIYFGITAFT